MDDKELLEMAAKAAGLEVSVAKGGGCWRNDGSKIWPKWHPLDDDGDALRLAMSLKLDIAIDDYVQVSWWKPDGCLQWVNENCCRRAIVRAAAEIGRSMP